METFWLYGGLGVLFGLAFGPKAFQWCVKIVGCICYVLRTCFDAPFRLFCEWIYAEFFAEEGKECCFLVFNSEDFDLYHCWLRNRLTKERADIFEKFKRLGGYKEPLAIHEQAKIDSLVDQFVELCLLLTSIHNQNLQLPEQFGQLFDGGKTLFVDDFLKLLREQTALDNNSDDPADDSTDDTY